ncbi:hypothetical protein PENSPDRAFT_692080 [Peniophora sp. CONT]|nr:hypothetical protein PENSPDRAFT_692080 [Peniophora sp. CONT]
MADTGTHKALVIGIDKYKSGDIERLHGAVADADDMVNFLLTELRVPRKQIVNLRNETATRKAILLELAALRKRDARKGDPFLIYFAGHGTTAEIMDDGKTGSKQVSMIVPYDGDVDWNENGLYEHNIPDWTVGALLHALAESKDGKGDNITVILDCCHSASGTRGAFRPRRTVMRKGYVIPLHLDKEIVSKTPRERGCKAATGFFKSGLGSHVLLAACGEAELAYEEEGRGVFTRALLGSLRATSAHKVTYEELMKRVKMNITIKDQHPQCEGRSIKRILFNGLSPSEMRVAYNVIQEGNKRLIKAGLAHGINEGALFGLYHSSNFTASDAPSAILAATTVKPFISELSISDSGLDLGPQASHFAMQISPGNVVSLHLHVPPDEGRPSVVLEALSIQLQRRQQPGRPSIQLADAAQADLSICVVNGRAEYRICNSLVNSHGLHELCETTMASAQDVLRVLRAASSFFWHLQRTPDKHYLRDQILLEVHELRPSIERDPYVGRLLSKHGDNLLLSGTVNVVADDETTFGITLKNKSLEPLHIWVFYFDCSDLSITECYRPPSTAHGAEPSLPPQGNLCVGYGAGGSQPFTCFLRSDQTLDVGFLKIFITTEIIDLSGMAQVSTFTGSKARDIRRLRLVREVEPLWDTIEIPLVQRRSGDSDV